MNNSQLLPLEVIESKIFLLRGQKIMLDKDLAELYGVETRDLNKAVKRNIDRFPDDFMFQLSVEEFQNLMFHFGTSSDARWGGTRKLPYAFTEQGVTMLSGVLSSTRAVQVNIAIMRAFVMLREILSAHKDLAAQFAELEKKYETHDVQIRSIFEALRQLMTPPAKPKQKMGFTLGEQKVQYTA